MALDLTVTSPPAKPATNKPTKSTAKTPGVVRSKDEITEHRTKICTEVVEGTAGLLALFGLHADAGMLMVHGNTIISTAVTTADEHEKAADAIEILGKSSLWFTVGGVILLLGTQVAVNHKWLKAEKFAGAGVKTPETLASIARTQLAEMEIEAMEQQEKAEEKQRELQRRRAEFASRNGQMAGV